MRQWSSVLVVLVLSACATHPAPAPAPSAPEALIEGKAEPPFLNVSISAFTNDNLRKGGENRIYAPIREVEASYLPVLLRNALNDSGNWGAVRVTPLPNVSAEVQVAASIVTSTALELALHVTVTDSRGITWIDKVYDNRAGSQTYAGEVGDDAFRGLFNQVANDMYRAKRALAQDDVENMLRASMLRYAASLSPKAFSRYLVEDGHGVIQVVGLPAADDKMYARVQKIRDSEFKFEDAMDDQYSTFYQQLKTIYPYWQRLSYELLDYNNRLNATGSKYDEKERSGTWAATKDVYDTFKEYKLNEDELRELATTFKSETQRSTFRLEGRVIELSGPLQDQFKQWKKILDQIYTLER